MSFLDEYELIESSEGSLITMTSFFPGIKLSPPTNTHCGTVMFQLNKPSQSLIKNQILVTEEGDIKLFTPPQGSARSYSLKLLVYLDEYP